MANYPYYVPQSQPMYQIPQQPIRQPYVEQQPQICLKGRPVSSIEEVRATSIDFDGSIFYFPDLANQKIYTKQINLDGTSTLNVYELRNVPVEPPVNLNQFITREEFEITLKQFQDTIQQLKEEKQQEVAPPQLNF